LVERDLGAIVNVSSVAAFVRSAGSTSYCSTKSWVAVFTEALHLDLKSARSHVVVQALCPGYTYSEFHDALGIDRRRMAPSSFWLTADEVVEASLEGLRRKRLYVVPGWRYRFLTSLVSKLPTSVRLVVETVGTRVRSRKMIEPR
jgi:short-subunit dehydrogenase